MDGTDALRPDPTHTRSHVREGKPAVQDENHRPPVIQSRTRLAATLSLVAILAVMFVGSVASLLARRHGGSVWGPTPLGWWAIGLTLPTLIAVVVVDCATTRRVSRISAPVLVALGIDAFVTGWVFRPTLAVPAVIGLGALVLSVVVILAWVRPTVNAADRRAAVLVLALVVMVSAGVALTLGVLIAGFSQQSVRSLGRSPDGRTQLVLVTVDEGALGAGVSIDVRRDFAGLLRFERTVVYPSLSDTNPRVRWLNDRTIDFQGRRLDVFTSSPFEQ